MKNTEVTQVKASLEELTRTLGLVCFTSLKNHPDPELVQIIENILARGRAAIELCKGCP